MKTQLAGKAQVLVRQQMLTIFDGRLVNDRGVVEAGLGDLEKLTLEKCDASELARSELLVEQRTGQIALARARASVPRAVAQAAACLSTMLYSTTDQGACVQLPTGLKQQRYKAML